MCKKMIYEFKKKVEKYKKTSELKGCARTVARLHEYTQLMQSLSCVYMQARLHCGASALCKCVHVYAVAPQ